MEIQYPLAYGINKIASASGRVKDSLPLLCLNLRGRGCKHMYGSLTRSLRGRGKNLICLAYAFVLFMKCTFIIKRK